jgi:hypothetical protein
MHKLSATVLCTSLFVLTSAYAQNLLSDPGFEAGNTPGNISGTFGTNWTLVTSGSHSDGVYSGAAHSGSFGAYIGGSGSSEGNVTYSVSLSQTVPVIAGDKYAVSFWAKDNSSVDFYNFSANFGGDKLFSSSTQLSLDYQQHSFSGIAGGHGGAYFYNIRDCGTR